MLARFFVVQHQPPFVTPVGEPHELGAMEEWNRFFFSPLFAHRLEAKWLRETPMEMCMVGSVRRVAIEMSLTSHVRFQESSDRRHDSASGRWPCSV